MTHTAIVVLIVVLALVFFVIALDTRSERYSLVNTSIGTEEIGAQITGGPCCPEMRRSPLYAAPYWRDNNGRYIPIYN